MPGHEAESPFHDVTAVSSHHLTLAIQTRKCTCRLAKENSEERTEGACSYTLWQQLLLLQRQLTFLLILHGYSHKDLPSHCVSFVFRFLGRRKLAPLLVVPFTQLVKPCHR